MGSELAEAAALQARLMVEQEATDLYTGDCRGCGECCSRFLPMSLLDRARLRAYVRRHGVAARAPRARLDLTCPYLTDGRECSVYEARPEVCRAYRCDLHVRGELDGFTGADRAVPVDMREFAESIEEKTEGDRG